MKYRTLGKTGLEVSAISLGTWQVGGKWGSGFDKKNAHKILNEAIDQGINSLIPPMFTKAVSANKR